MVWCARVLVFSLLLGVQAAAAEPPLAIGTFRIGEPTAQVRAEHGDPLRFVQISKATIAARYAVPGGALFVYERGGAVVGLQLTSGKTPALDGTPLEDEHGAKLGLERSAALALHATPPVVDQADHAVWRLGQTAETYGFDAAGVLQVINIASAPVDPIDNAVVAVVSPPGEHDASSIDNAIRIVMDVDDSGLWETFYLALHECAPNAVWKHGRHRLVRQNERSFDVEEASCPVGGATATFYFDVTAVMATSLYNPDGTPKRRP